MTDTRKSNKKSATEDELGEIHSMTTKLHALRLRHMLEQVSSGMDVEAVIGDGKALQSAGKWAADQNNITASQPELDEETELASALNDIKRKQTGRGAAAESVPFDDELH